MEDLHFHPKELEGSDPDLDLGHDLTREDTAVILEVAAAMTDLVPEIGGPAEIEGHHVGIAIAIQIVGSQLISPRVGTKETRDQMER